MVPIMNVPFLARTMERLYEAGIRDVILPAGYMPQAIVDYFGDGSSLGMKITYVDRGDAARHRRRAQERRAAHHRSVLRAQRRHPHQPRPARDAALTTKRRAALGALHLIRVEDPSAFGCVVHDADGRISAFVEKPPKGEAPTNEINAGTYLLEREVLDLIPAGPQRVDRTRNVPGDSSPAAKRSTRTRPPTIGSISAVPNSISRRIATCSAARCRSRSSRAFSGDGARRAARASRRRPRRSTPTPTSSSTPSAKIGPNVVLGRGCSDRRRCRHPRLRPVGSRERRAGSCRSKKRSSRAASRSAPEQASVPRAASSDTT